MHTMGWQDDRMAQVYCVRNGQYLDVGIIHADVDDKDDEFKCAKCGVFLRLVWNVQLVEVTHGAS